MVDEYYIVFEIYMGIAYEPLTEPLTEEQKHRFRNTLEQIVHEPRRWKNIEKLKKAVRRRERILDKVTGSLTKSPQI